MTAAVIELRDYQTDALERIAVALEQMSAARISTWKPYIGTGGVGGNGTVCSQCGTWYPVGTVHYCGSVAR